MANSTKVLEISQAINQDDGAKAISRYWDRWNQQRQDIMAQWSETKKYIFATDTKSTTNRVLPWSNTTTTPKICQIRDNLHSNYLSAIFPNDKWLQWTAYTADDAAKTKASTITSYMDNKSREGNLRSRISRLLLDYIDYGNVFSMASYEARYSTAPDGSQTPSFVGPVAERLSPEDIVFNPLATDFDKTPKIIRSVKTIGELLRLSQTNPDQKFWQAAAEKRIKIRQNYGAYRYEDWAKAAQYTVDGFGNLYEYYMSDYVEILEFYGDFHVQGQNTVEVNRMLTVVDRCDVVRNEPINTYSGNAPIQHTGWRKRPDNLWCMGPLDNLIGMQYRIDHLENLSADAMDLAVWPPLKIKGEVEEFVWGPGSEIHTDENGDVEEVMKSLSGVIQADNKIAELENKMELYAGAPREAMGIRTPGEKTAFEVGQITAAAGRIFQEKVTNFEIELFEPLLNAMLEQAVINFDEMDVVRVLDTDLGVTQFRAITKDDIVAKGILRPVGARHFAQQAQDLQNLVGIANSPLWTTIQPDIDRHAVTAFLSNVLNVPAYQMFRPNVAVIQAKETQALAGQASEDNAVDASGPSEADAPNLPPDQLDAKPDANAPQGAGIENISA